MADLVGQAEAREDDIRAMFQQHDTNRDGSLQPDELARLLAALGLPAAAHDVAEAYYNYDSNKDGDISFEEFKGAFNRLMAASKKTKETQAKYAAIHAEEAAVFAALQAERAGPWAAARDAALAAQPEIPAAWPFRRSNRFQGAKINLSTGQCDAEDVAALQAASQTTLWLFASSTFVDTSAERNYWQSLVFPDVESRAESLGLTFDSVDLRWGMTDAFGDGHDTTDVCLAEIGRCMKTSAGAAFLFLSGERYGWRALPKRVPAAEFESLRSSVAAESASALPVIDAWYARDDNALPAAVYELRPMSVVKATPGVAPEVADFWAAQDVMAVALRSAAAGAGLAADRLDDWELSVTHKEVAAGLAAATADGRGLLVHRTLDGLANAPQGDRTADAHRVPPGSADATLLSRLRQEAEALFPRDSPLAQYVTHPWRGRKLAADDPSDGNYIRGLGAKLFAQLTRDAESVAASRAGGAAYDAQLQSPLDADAVAQAATAVGRAAARLGRDRLVASLRDLMRPSGSPSTPRVVFGPPGSGKSCALAAAATKDSSLPDYTATVLRCCGASAGASTARGVAMSLAAQLNGSRPLGEWLEPDEAGAVPEPLDRIGTTLRRLLEQQSKPDRPVRVVLDSLESLAAVERSRLLEWLPAETPAHCTLTLCFTVDTAPGSPGQALLAVLRSPGAAVDSSHFIEVPALAPAEAGVILDESLAARGRRVSVAQRAALGGALSGGDSTALKVALLAAEAARWSSWTPLTPSLPESVSGLLAAAIARAEARHTIALTEKVLSLLATSAGGLSRRNLLDLISADDDAMGYKGAKGTVLQFTDAPIRRCPPLVLVRLMDELGPAFLAERGLAKGAGAGFRLASDSARAAVERRYLAAPHRRASCLGTLADYFGGALCARHPARGLESHRRRHAVGLPTPQDRHWPTAQAASEYAAALLALGSPQLAASCPGLAGAARPSELRDLVCSLDGVAGAVADGRLPDLLATAAAASAQLAGTDAGTDVAQFHRWLRQSGPRMLGRRPELVYVEALAAPVGSVPLHALESLCAPGEGRLILTGVWAPANRRAALPACVAILAEPPRPRGGVCIDCMDVHPLSGHVAASGYYRVIVVWDAVSGTVVRKLTGHGGPVESLRYSPDGAYLVSTSASDAAARVWSGVHGALLHILALPFAPTRAAVSSRGVVAIPGAADRSVALFSAEDGSALSPIAGPPGSDPIAEVVFTPDGSKIATLGYQKDGAIHIVDVATRSEALVIAFDPKDIEAVRTVDFSCDGALLAGGGTDRAHPKANVRIWDASTGSLRHSLEGHRYQVMVVRFARRDPRLLASGGNDNEVRLWDAIAGACLRTFVGHTKIAMGACVLDSSTVVSGSQDGTLRLWHTGPGEGDEKPAEGHAGYICAWGITADGGVFATASRSVALQADVRFWAAATGETRGALPNVAASAIALSPDGRRLVTLGPLDPRGSGDHLRTWDVQSVGPGAAPGAAVDLNDGGVVGRTPSQYRQCTDGYAVLAFSPDGTKLATADSLGALIWDAESLRLLLSIPGVVDSVTGSSRANAVCWSDDGRTLAVAYTFDGAELLRTHDAAGGDKRSETGRLTNAVGTSHAGNVRGLRLSDDGRTCAVWLRPANGPDRVKIVELGNADAPDHFLAGTAACIPPNVFEAAAPGGPPPAGTGASGSPTCQCLWLDREVVVTARHGGASRLAFPAGRTPLHASADGRGNLFVVFEEGMTERFVATA